MASSSHYEAPLCQHPFYEFVWAQDVTQSTLRAAREVDDLTIPSYLDRRPRSANHEPGRAIGANLD